MLKPTPKISCRLLEREANTEERFAPIWRDAMGWQPRITPAVSNELLEAQARKSGSFLESPASRNPSRLSIIPLARGPGTIIGPYKLLQQIGEGGMGIVFMAEQNEPLRRTVALKIIKPGMDTRQVIARFEAERQALAMMDHPNIARVLDAGTTDSGRPYFVMELVKVCRSPSTATRST